MNDKNKDRTFTLADSTNGSFNNTLHWLDVNTKKLTIEKDIKIKKSL